MNIVGDTGGLHQIHWRKLHLLYFDIQTLSCCGAITRLRVFKYQILSCVVNMQTQKTMPLNQNFIFRSKGELGVISVLVVKYLFD